MRIRTNQTHGDKVQDLFSPMIPIFHLSLKNSQRYDHGKKSSKRCGVFCPQLYMCFSKSYFMFTIKTNTLSLVTFQKFFVCAKFQWWRSFCKIFFKNRLEFHSDYVKSHLFYLITVQCYVEYRVGNKKTPHLLELFFPWSYLYEFLRLR